jgi:hypothetical protein
MNITVGYPQTNRKNDTGKTLTRWPVFVDHFSTITDGCRNDWGISRRQKRNRHIMLPSETVIWQPEFTDKTLSRKTGAVQQLPLIAYVEKN